MNKCLAMITMNAGKDIPGSTIMKTLSVYGKYFDRVIVVDGNLSEEARLSYSELENVELTIVDSPWKDSYVDQYRAWSSKVDDEDWVLYLDCDEVPSRELIDFIFSEEFDIKSKECNTFCLPCVLYLRHNSEYCAAEKEPPKEYIGQWIKNILVKKDSSLDFKYFGSHVIPNHGQEEKGSYVPFPYFHMKTLESFVYNDVWQAFLSPEGQQYTPADAKMFKMLTKQYKTTKEFKEATKCGAWPPVLKKFAWDRRWVAGYPVSRLAWVYFILEGNEFLESDSDFTWETVKNFVLRAESIDVFNKNIGKENFFKWT